MIFSKHTRTDSSPKNNQETVFQHIDRSSRPEYEKMRLLIETWCSRVPNREQDEVIARITSNDDLAFHSTFFELYVHELLLATRHSIKFHPELPNTTKRPDFLVTDPDGDQFIVECTVATEESKAEQAAQARLGQVLDSINKVICKDVFLDLRIDGTPNTPVPGKSWRSSIQSWVESLDYEALLGMGPDPTDSELPEIELGHDGLQLTIKPIPKSPSARGTSQRPIGVESYEGCMVTSHVEISKTISDKAGYYGKLTSPYIVAVNCLGALADEEEIHRAMFGQAGLWSNSNIRRHTRVSSVLALHHLLPWSISTASANLFHNPYAALPYTGKLTNLTQWTFNSSFKGSHPRDLLGIDSAWPYG